MTTCHPTNAQHTETIYQKARDQITFRFKRDKTDDR